MLQIFQDVLFVFFDVFARQEVRRAWRGRAGVVDQMVREAARELGEHKEDNTDVLSVRQARTICHRLPGEDREQRWLQAPVEQGWQVQIEERSQAQEQAQGRATIEEEGRPWQEGTINGQSE
jgi:hypothetical protein